ncbi:MAG: formamidopyrimidine-DNA glycosylase [Chloroflexota bacterium]|nr:formamidopyrimidine-DNA glycosylase [Chloroflexota bacterium]MDE3101883.1 formamidopyrimidine-DNA glycosylase [Chloroflexota bacterium]
MPELPDVEAYLEALRRVAVGHVFERVRVASPIILRTFDPPIREAEGKRVRGVRRIGKRIVLELEDGLYLVVHLMIAGRFHWKPKGTRVPARVGHAALDLDDGTLLLTEANATKRAALHLVRGDAALAAFARGGIEPLEADLDTFREALTRESHTLKRALTDPTIFSGIGNAYSDEILHRARLAPTKLTRALEAGEIERLWRAARDVLREWTERLVAEARERFPEKVTAFRPEMAVHGRYGKPCPACGSPVQRVVYAENEANYCATCQTGGKLLADRALSRLLREDWPCTLSEMEERLGR